MYSLAYILIMLSRLIATIIVLIFFCIKEAKSTHLVGGEIYYDCLGPDTSINGNFLFKLNMTIYRDCFTGGAPFDLPAYMVRFNEAGFAVDTFFMYYDSIASIPTVVNNPCVVAPPNICVEAAYYSHTISIPGGMGDFTISNQRCCRNPTIANILEPGSVGSTYTTVIKDPAVYNCNSSPRFNDFPPTAICNNYPIAFDHSATDPDGDSLVYEFCTPLAGGSEFNPKPYAIAPPYTHIGWKASFNATDPLVSANPLSLSSTGFLDGIPTALGQYVVGVCVSEYRDNTLLSTTFRDFQFNIADCNPKVISSIQDQIKFCEGLKYKMINQSVGGSAYKWDFGVKGVESDTTRLRSPTFIFPDTGFYKVSLIVNPGWPCSDTSSQIFDVRDTLKVFLDQPAPQCLEGNLFQFEAKGLFSSEATFIWKLPKANNSSSSFKNPSFSYAEAGTFKVKLTVEQDGCQRSDSVQVQVIENPKSDFDFVVDSSCIPFTVHFTEESTFADDPVFKWDFGDGGTGTGRKVSHTYTSAGSYDVGLLVENYGKCIDTNIKVHKNAITALPLPFAAFLIDRDQVSKFDADVRFTDASIHSEKVEYFPMEGIKLQGPDQIFHFPDTGHYVIMQISYNRFGCSDTSFKTVYVYDEYHFYIPNAFTPNDDGTNDLYHPVVSGVDKFLFQIFNRWGELIFETADHYEGWDGTRNGKKSQFGNYVYKVETIDLLGNEYSYAGSFLLIR